MTLYEFGNKLEAQIEQLRELRNDAGHEITGIEGFWVDTSDIITSVTVRLDKLLAQVRLRTPPPFAPDTPLDRDRIPDSKYQHIPDQE